MTLASVGRGDIVRAGGAHGIVTDKERGKVQARWIGSNSIRWIKASEVEAHWKRRG